MLTPTGHRDCVESRGQLAGAQSFLPSCESWALPPCQPKNMKLKTKSSLSHWRKEPWGGHRERCLHFKVKRPFVPRQFRRSDSQKQVLSDCRVHGPWTWNHADHSWSLYALFSLKKETIWRIINAERLITPFVGYSGVSTDMQSDDKNKNT